MDVRAHDIRVVLPDMGSWAQWKVASAQVDIQHVLAQLPPHYDLTIAHIGLLHPQGLASIDSLRFIPRMDRTTTREHLREDDHHVRPLDVKRIALAREICTVPSAEQQVEVGSLTMDGALFHAFLDKSMPDAPSHFMPLPVSALRNVPFGLRMDTLRVTHANMN